jgi:hypothetical protein
MGKSRYQERLRCHLANVHFHACGLTISLLDTADTLSYTNIERSDHPHQALQIMEKSDRWNFASGQGLPLMSSFDITNVKIACVCVPGRMCGTDLGRCMPMVVLVPCQMRHRAILLSRSKSLPTSMSCCLLPCPHEDEY